MSDPHGRKFMDLITKVNRMEEEYNQSKVNFEDKICTLGNLCTLVFVFCLVNLVLSGWIWFSAR